MKQLNEHHTFTGMQRDIDVLKHPANFLYDAKNVRLTAREDNTLFAISTEKGTTATTISLEGTYLGHCVLNQYLVVFTTSTNANPDYIYRIDLNATPVSATILFNGDLNFNSDHLIEAIASYENEDIQKVYWTDGYNQPRMINIVGEHDYNNLSFDFIREIKLEETVTVEKLLGSAGGFAPGVIQYAFTYFTKYGQESNIFYTTPLLYVSNKDRGASPEEKVDNAFKINIFNPDTNFDYVRVYSIQRTSINSTPITKRVVDLGIKESIDSNVTEVLGYTYSGKILFVDGENEIPIIGSEFPTTTSPRTIGVDNTYWYHFDYADYPNLKLRAGNKYITWGENTTGYSIVVSVKSIFSSSSLKKVFKIYCVDLTQISPVLKEFNTLDLYGTISYTDIGTSGDSIDPTELLYKGGESIIAQTIEQKDGTLFLGNITINREPINSDIKSVIETATIEDATRSFTAQEVTGNSNYYNYQNQLISYASITINGKTINNSVPCGGFKCGDYYRLGVQFQHKTGKWSDPVYIKDFKVTGRPTILGNDLSLPAIKGTIQNCSSALLSAGYKRARAVVVFPEMQDRVSICQGVVCPTVKLNDANDNKYQSSWFFRPDFNGTAEENDGTVALNDQIQYKDIDNTLATPAYDPSNIRHIEIQGTYSESNRFCVSRSAFTFHSPDIEFDTQLTTFNFENTSYLEVGKASISSTLSDINIQTETPTISSNANGFFHKSSNLQSSNGFMTGLFYEDYLVDDDTDIKAYRLEKSPLKWFVYPWHRTGSLNNDAERPVNKGVRSSVLKKKVLSNLRYTSAVNWADTSTSNKHDCPFVPQVFNSDNLSILKSGLLTYNGNIDTVLSPDASEGMYFAFGSGTEDNPPIQIQGVSTSTPFNSSNYWRTGSVDIQDSNNNTYKETLGLFYWSNSTWQKSNDGKLGDQYSILSVNKESVRMKYKSSPHALLPFSVSPTMTISNERALRVYEILNKDDEDSNHPGYRLSMFGGNLSYGNPIPTALQSNNWVPCGEPVLIEDGEDIEFYYSYGDTYYQRWDCLKTYPFTPEDINQIVEIGSFMLETRVNIDGRYDRNRGLLDNTNISPTNFNLLNPVYSQINNFFSYKIMDDQYYNITSFPNEITWTKEKSAGADVDLWTNITMSSTYDMDGSKGEVVSLNTWKDNLYCFQNKGVSAILFNSRVQIPTSDGVPIEITNSYKVDGYRYLSDGVGCNKRELIKETPAGVYFIDSISSHLYYIGEGMQNVTATHNMSSWFNMYGNTIKKIEYDDVNKDLYLIKTDKSLCYSEMLGQFTSFMDYNDISLVSTYNGRVFTLKDNNLYIMFEGDYNLFFDDYHPWEISFISNGADSGASDISKIFTNIDYRMKSDENAQPNGYESSLDIIRVVDSYQDTDTVALNRRKRITYPSETSADVVQANLKKKFSTWRIQIPRDKIHKLDRIRDTWCKITLTCNGYYYPVEGEDTKIGQEVVLHDLNVQYYI